MGTAVETLLPSVARLGWQIRSSEGGRTFAGVSGAASTRRSLVSDREITQKQMDAVFRRMQAEDPRLLPIFARVSYKIPKDYPYRDPGNLLGKLREKSDAQS